jgi:hypothetical protein
MPRVKFERRIRTFIRRGEGFEQHDPAARSEGRA